MLLLLPFAANGETNTIHLPHRHLFCSSTSLGKASIVFTPVNTFASFCVNTFSHYVTAHIVYRDRETHILALLLMSSRFFVSEFTVCKQSSAESKIPLVDVLSGRENLLRDTLNCSQ